jgi:hypothetical protein
MAFRASTLLRGGATSNMIAPPGAKRWFNPPHVWTVQDAHYVLWTLCACPPIMVIHMYYAAKGHYMSHYQDKNYYPMLPYSKEFIHKYKRMERWRHY